MLKSFTNELKKTREDAGISLEGVSAKTRIDIKFLKALERGDVHFLPEIYVKAFVKQYAKVIGLDEDETLQKYLLAIDGKKLPDKEDETVDSEIAETETKDQESQSQKTEDQEDKKKTLYSYSDESAKDNRSSKSIKKKSPQVYFVGILIAVVGVVLIYFLFVKDRENNIVVEKPFDEVLRDTPKRFVNEEVDQIPKENSPKNIEELTLTLINNDPTDSAWVFVVMDNKTSREFLLFPKTSQTFKAKSNFKFTLGNSGVIEMKMNSEKIEFKKKRGAVRYYKLDKNGLERIYTPPQINQE
jgi:transcriptional regulator with XRE-family HTH domain